jgi:hypothetical protein
MDTGIRWQAAAPLIRQIEFLTVFFRLCFQPFIVLDDIIQAMKVTIYIFLRHLAAIVLMQGKANWSSVCGSNARGLVLNSGSGTIILIRQDLGGDGVKCLQVQYYLQSVRMVLTEAVTVDHCGTTSISLRATDSAMLRAFLPHLPSA